MEIILKKKLLELLYHHPDYEFLKKKSKSYLLKFITMNNLSLPGKVEKEIKDNTFETIFISSLHHPNQNQCHNS